MKKRCPLYMPENQQRLMQLKAKEILGKESASWFAFAASGVVLGMLGCKPGWSYSENDKWAIKALKKACLSHNQ